MTLLDRRIEKFKSVIANRQFDIGIVLENVHDPHNIGAVLRSCDSVGIQHVYIVNTDIRIQDRSRYEELSTSTGAAKWMTIHYYEDLKLAVKDIKHRYAKLIGTHLESDASAIFDFDFTDSFALAFGNEHVGITQELLDECDHNVLIPQFGMVQSLNISVACAVCLFEISRQRTMKNAYNKEFDATQSEQKALLSEWENIHKASKRRRKITKLR